MGAYMRDVVTWGGYAEGDPTLVAGIVCLIFTASVLFFAQRFRKGRR
jgi:hypothetical protein